MGLNFLRPLLQRWTRPSAYIFLEQFAKVQKFAYKSNKFHLFTLHQSAGKIAVGYCDDLITVLPIDVSLASEGDDDSIDDTQDRHRSKITRTLTSYINVF